jgi:hypothetical protein
MEKTVCIEPIDGGIIELVMLDCEEHLKIAQKYSDVAMLVWLVGHPND